MPKHTGQSLSEADLLTRAVENVFRKLIRFLVGRISLVRLQEMIRYIYVDETEKKLRRENPGKNVPMTKLALTTGLDTRTLIRVRSQLERGEEQYRQQFLAELTPESAVVEAWADQAGRSRQLSYGSDSAGFEKLVRSTISTRGITTQSIIQRLLATRSIEQDKRKRTLKLLVDHYSPYLSDDEPNIVNAAFSAISNLLSTIEYNVDASPEEKLFQRQKWTFRLQPAELDHFRRDMRQMLEQFEYRTNRTIAPWESSRYDKNLLTAGVGLYYFEDLGLGR